MTVVNYMNRVAELTDCIRAMDHARDCRTFVACNCAKTSFVRRLRVGIIVVSG